ncbi:MAG: hypothetical protein CSB44_04990 [Gammaproteobacteria bacterium]|nr:MAG: hypothetical protein CSB44_04990 [Gammaproteobacteria bacterium]
MIKRSGSRDHSLLLLDDHALWLASTGEGGKVVWRLLARVPSGAEDGHELRPWAIDEDGEVILPMLLCSVLEECETLELTPSETGLSLKARLRLMAFGRADVPLGDTLLQALRGGSGQTRVSLLHAPLPRAALPWIEDLQNAGVVIEGVLPSSRMLAACLGGEASRLEIDATVPGGDARLSVAAERGRVLATGNDISSDGDWQERGLPVMRERRDMSFENGVPARLQLLFALWCELAGEAGGRRRRGLPWLRPLWIEASRTRLAEIRRAERMEKAQPIALLVVLLCVLALLGTLWRALPAIHTDRARQAELVEEIHEDLEVLHARHPVPERASRQLREVTQLRDTMLTRPVALLQLVGDVLGEVPGVTLSGIEWWARDDTEALSPTADLVGSAMSLEVNDSGQASPWLQLKLSGELSDEPYGQLGAAERQRRFDELLAAIDGKQAIDEHVVLESPIGNLLRSSDAGVERDQARFAILMRVDASVLDRRAEP